MLTFLCFYILESFGMKDNNDNENFIWKYNFTVLQLFRHYSNSLIQPVKRIPI